VNLVRLETFVEVVRHGTFAGAAAALSFTPSAVSQQMAKLEAEVGTPLFEREDAGGRRPTEAGRLLHEHALGILAAVNRAQAGLEALQADQVKRLRLGACPIAAAAVLPRALRILRRRLPGAELVVEEDAAVRLAVLEGRVDVGVWMAPAGGEEDPGMVEVVLVREALAVALAADHPLARLEHLDEPALAATPRLGGARSRVSSLPVLLAMAAAGEGYALVPAVVAAQLPPGVVLRPLAGAPEWELRAGRPAQDVLSVGILAALDALRRVSGGKPTAVRPSSGVGAGAQ
jgi:DNA-binding transcriptional LysR family regulator